MRGRALIVLACAAFGGMTAVARAQPVTGPHETVDQAFTTTRPHSATGVRFAGIYHAAHDPHGNPPFMRRMVFYPPRGMRYDTSVPARCAATDVQLEALGPAACPAGSRLGSGTVDGIFFVPLAHTVVFDRFHHDVDVLNGASEQILLVKSEGYTVVRNRFRPDGSIEVDTPACFPAPPAGGCADDYILQLKSATAIAPYTRGSRSYARTPPRCPHRGYWRTTIRWWWSDGSADRVVSRQPCRRPRARRRR